MPRPVEADHPPVEPHRPYVGRRRHPDDVAYVDLAARVLWQESGHFTAERAEPDRYLIGRHALPAGDQAGEPADLLPVELPDPEPRRFDPGRSW